MITTHAFISKGMNREIKRLDEEGLNFLYFLNYFLNTYEKKIKHIYILNP